MSDGPLGAVVGVVAGTRIVCGVVCGEVSGTTGAGRSRAGSSRVGSCAGVVRGVVTGRRAGAVTGGAVVVGRVGRAGRLRRDGRGDLRAAWSSSGGATGRPRSSAAPATRTPRDRLVRRAHCDQAERQYQHPVDHSLDRERVEPRVSRRGQRAWTRWWIRWPVDQRPRDAARPAARCRAPATRRRVRRRRSTRQEARCPSAGRARHHRDVPPPSRTPNCPRSSRDRERPAPVLRAGSTGRERAVRTLLELPRDLPTAPARRIPIAAVHWNGCATNVAHITQSGWRMQDVRSGCAPTRGVWRMPGPDRWATPDRPETCRPAVPDRRLAASIRARPGACRGSRGGTG